MTELGGWVLPSSYGSIKDQPIIRSYTNKAVDRVASRIPRHLVSPTSTPILPAPSPPDHGRVLPSSFYAAAAPLAAAGACRSASSRATPGEVWCNGSYTSPLTHRWC